MFFKDGLQAYKILEIEKSASNDEVKKAYRNMAKKYHPDRVVTDNEAIKKDAEEKFKKVQKAYETIQKKNVDWRKLPPWTLSFFIVMRESHMC